MRYTAEPDTDPRFNAILDAAQDEPVYIERNQQAVAVVVSADRYERLRQAAIDELNRFCDEVSDRAEANGMTEEILQELLKDD